MTINDVLPSSGHAGALARAITSPHHDRDPRACGETHGPAASPGPAAPIFGSIFLERKKIQLPRKFRCRFEFDRYNVQTRCFANFLDVR
jgi:hypothetical protein